MRVKAYVYVYRYVDCRYVLNIPAREMRFPLMRREQFKCKLWGKSKPVGNGQNLKSAQTQIQESLHYKINVKVMSINHINCAVRSFMRTYTR